MRLVTAIVGASLLAGAVSRANAQDITAATAGEIQRLLWVAAGPDTSMPVWTVRHESPPAYRRNRVVWTRSGVDLTGKAVWNTHTGTGGTTAISARHVVYVDHVKGLYPAGTIVRFVSNADALVERTVVNSVRIEGSDVDLSTLDSPLPAAIHWYKVMPEHWFLHCSRRAPRFLGGMPCLVLDANTSSVAVKDLTGFFPNGYETSTPVDPLRRSFTRELHAGDSGSPVFLLVGRELVLDGLYLTAKGGAELSDQIAPLNAAMSDVGDTVTVADLGALLAAGGVPIRQR